MGPDLYSMKGKTTRMTSPVADVTVGPAILQQQQVMCIDIMFVEQLPFLVADVSPLELTLVKSLSTVDKRRLGRTAEAVGAGIKYFLGVLNAQRFVVRVIMSDGEGAVSKLQQELNSMGVEVDISGAGGHVQRVERKIRVIKERVRVTMHSLPYTLSTLGIIMCVLYCVSRLNYEPSGTRQSGISAREAFLGRKIDEKRDFRCAYGDYAQCTVPTTNNSMVARTDDCVVMMPTGNRTGSVKVLSLSTGRIVSRDQLKILPMPESVIAQLNALARQDGRLSVKKGGHRPDTPLDALHPHPVPHIPDFFIPVAHHGGDPDMQANEHDGGIEAWGAPGLADHAGLGPHEDRNNARGGEEPILPVINPVLDETQLPVLEPDQAQEVENAPDIVPPHQHNLHELPEREQGEHGDLEDEQAAAEPTAAATQAAPGHSNMSILDRGERRSDAHISAERNREQNI